MPIANLFQPPLPQQLGQHIYWQNLQGGSRGIALSQAMSNSDSPILIVTADRLMMNDLIEELTFFDTNLSALTIPDWETLPYDHFSPHEDIISERLTALYHSPTLKRGAIFTNLTTLMQRLPPPQYLAGHHIVLAVGDTLNLDLFRQKLNQAGYHAVSEVRGHGEYAIRGSILDLFPMGSRMPFRIDLLDDEVDSIRTFSLETQRSLEKIKEIRLLPAKEFPMTEAAIELFRQNWRTRFSGNPLQSPIYQDISEGICSAGIEYYFPLFFQETATLFDYLPNNTLIITLGDIQQKGADYWHEINTRYEQSRFDVTRPLLAPTELFIPLENLNQALNQRQMIAIIEREKAKAFTFATEAAPNLDIQYHAAQPLSALQSYLSQYTSRILFCVETIGRREVVLQLLNSIDLHPTFFQSWQAFLASEVTYGIVVAPIEKGFILTTPAMTVLTESHLFSHKVMQRRLRKKSTQDTDALIRDLTELQIGDAVVHIDHGVGRYQGLNTLTIGDQVAEFLCLEYQDAAKLYVPVSSLHLISRYTGTDSEHIPITRLGTEQWSRAKRKAAEKIRDVAAELLDIYAKRAARPGHTYQMPEEQYNAFAAAFPFEETPDQLHAIQQVFSDLCSDRPMDRVICGDVGFGKTEVALRAAFFAVHNHQQVALLVPTTLLAQQHFQNFQDRLADWPIQVDVLSRFRTAKEQKQILEKLKKGQIDIIIGTHKLLQDDIQFKSLGLVIIDEEHRFGVKQKEKFKALRAMVDVLTLTATPIPRTLNMAMSGIRDLSIIATPPARRLSVKTFLHEYQDSLIQEAIQREILRGGQVYFLHNDITTINKKIEEIIGLVPEARPIVAHGQMHERELERVMSDFYHRRYNVLVCTTIIESGIDIPSANTIIINRADQFGIAQLHQLRGRVGRSHHQAYAYLLVPSKKQITDEAKKRLEAITAYDDLGVGFTLSTHDLEIRGAGELLGEQQSGDMQEIGFTLYMDLLSRAVDALKAGKEPDLEKSLLLQRAEVDLRLPAYIPDAYLGDVSMRLQFYKRIANAKSSAELEDIQVEMIDRFGLIPEQLKYLFAMSELKSKADALGIIKLEANNYSGKFEFCEKPTVNPETIIRLIQLPSKRFRLDGPTRLRFTLDKHEPHERIQLVHKLLDQLN